MATGKLLLNQEKPSYPTGSDHFEFDEADIWNLNDAIGLEPKKPYPVSKLSRRLSRIKVDSGDRAVAVVASASVPMNVPDWPKILKEEYRKRESDEGFNDEIGGGRHDDEDGRVPPHEYLARKRGASLSVHEGIGRTLKGRDLRRVRNAIWQKTGFED